MRGHEEGKSMVYTVDTLHLEDSGQEASQAAAVLSRWPVGWGSHVTYGYSFDSGWAHLNKSADTKTGNWQSTHGILSGGLRHWKCPRVHTELRKWRQRSDNRLTGRTPWESCSRLCPHCSVSLVYRKCLSFLLRGKQPTFSWVWLSFPHSLRYMTTYIIALKHDTPLRYTIITPILEMGLKCRQSVAKWGLEVGESDLQVSAC